MKSILSAALAISLLAGPLQGASIVANALTDNGFSTFGGTDLAVGNLVRIGTFVGLTDSDILSLHNAGNLAALNAAFREFGTTHIGDRTAGLLGPNPLPGLFSSGEIAHDTSSAQFSLFADAQVYLWVFRTVGNVDPTGNFSNVLEQGILYADKNTATNWRFRAEATLPNSTSVDITDLTSDPAQNTLSAAAHLVVGGFGALAPGTPDVSDATGAANFRLSPVPEPASAALLAIGAVAFGLSRRRRA